MQDAPFQYVRVDVVGRIGWLTMDRPDKRNALNQAMKQEMVRALGSLEEDPAVRVIVLTGAGPAFAAGTDIAEIQDLSPFQYRDTHRLPRIWDALEACKRPVIAAINGLALGGGCELALSCDYRIAADSAAIGQPEINLGVIPGAGGTQRLPRLVGEGQAMRIILTGDPIDAAEAKRIGLIEEVVPDDALRDAATRVGERMARHSPVALELAKEAIKAAKRMPLDAGLAYERQLMALCFASDDKREGIEAFFARRTPTYGGT